MGSGVGAALTCGSTTGANSRSIFGVCSLSSVTGAESGVAGSAFAGGICSGAIAKLASVFAGANGATGVNGAMAGCGAGVEGEMALVPAPVFGMGASGGMTKDVSGFNTSFAISGGISAATSLAIGAGTVCAGAALLGGVVLAVAGACA